MHRAPSRPAHLFCAEGFLGILSLKANIGVWARARAHSVEHEDSEGVTP
jgi:hypothetical protein